MKVGILTFHRVNNYGAVLQNYALQKAIRLCGHEAETIDYHCDYIYRPYKLINLKQKGFIDYFMGVSGHIVYSLREQKTQWLRQQMKFSYPVTTQTIATLNDKYDLFITGSDQVWNYKLTNFDRTFFLDFVKDKNKKISYGASFGLKQIDKAHCEAYGMLLNDFRFLSVRERTGADIIESLIDRKAKIVVDPTFLLTSKEWSSVAKIPDCDSDYILVYQLGFCASTLNFVQELAKKTGCMVICLPFPMGKWISCKCGFTEGPAELLGLIKNAKYVVTSSFHGAALSILFNKNFFVEIPKGTASMSSRIEDLLDELNLKDRFLVNGKSHFVQKNIDYAPINNKIMRKREDSINYLKELLDKHEGE